MQSQDECSTIEIVDTHVFQAILEPEASKWYMLACAPIEDSDQIALARKLIRVFYGRSTGSQESNVSSGGKLSMRSDCAHAQTDLNRYITTCQLVPHARYQLNN